MGGSGLPEESPDDRGDVEPAIAPTTDDRLTSAAASATRRRSVATMTGWLGRRHLPAMVLAGALLGEALLLGFYANRLWFLGGDDWDFLLKRGTISGYDRGLFAPHEDHWSTGVVLVMKILFWFFGIRTYLPYGLVVIVLHAAICGLIYVGLCRAECDRWIALWTVLLVAFLGTGAQAFLWDTSMGLLFSMAFGLVAMLVVEREFRSSVMIQLFLIMGLMFSGLGLVMVLTVSVSLVMRRGRRDATEILWPVIAIYAIWYASFGWKGRISEVSSPWDVLGAPRRVWEHIDATLSGALHLPGAGGLVFVAIVVHLCVWQSGPAALRRWSLAGLAGGLSQLLLATLTRITDPQGRYSYVFMVFLAPAMAYGLTHLAWACAAARPLGLLLGLVSSVALVTNGLLEIRSFQAQQRIFTDPWPGRIRGLVAGSDAGQKILNPRSTEWFSAGFDAELLVRPEIRGKLPSGMPTDEERVDAAGHFFVGVQGTTFGLFRPTAMTLIYFNDEPISDAGCATYQASVETPVITLDIGLGGDEISVSSASTRITTFVRTAEHESDRAVWDVTAGEPVFVASTAAGTQLVMVFDKGGSYRVCTGGVR